MTISLSVNSKYHLDFRTRYPAKKSLLFCLKECCALRFLFFLLISPKFEFSLTIRGRGLVTGTPNRLYIP
jgi:hypothetical protein